MPVYTERRLQVLQYSGGETAHQGAMPSIPSSIQSVVVSISVNKPPFVTNARVKIPMKTQETRGICRSQQHQTGSVVVFTTCSHHVHTRYHSAK